MNNKTNKPFIKYFLCGIFFMCVFTSCNNLLNGKQEINKEKAYINITTNLSSNARTVFPDGAFTAESRNLTWVLLGKKNGATNNEIKSWQDENSQTGKTAYQRMISDSSIVLDVGKWSLTLIAKNNEDKKVLEATIEKNIKVGTNSLSFIMKDAVGEGAASGQIDFTLKWKGCEAVHNVKAFLNKKIGSDFEKTHQANLNIVTSDDSNYGYVNFSDSTLTPGNYILKLELQQHTGTTEATENTFEIPIYTTINTYTCLIHVAPGLCSKGVETLETLAPLYEVTFEEGIEFVESIVPTSYNAYTTFALPTIKKAGYEYQWYKNCYDFNSYYQELVDDPSNVSITEDTTFGVKCYKIVAEKDIFRTAKGVSTGDSKGDSFSIRTAEGLGIFRDLVNGCNENLKMVDNSGKSEDGYVYYDYGLVSYQSQLNATLTLDIDLTQLKDADEKELSWVPINGYSGTFDGGGHTITVNNTYQVNVKLYYQGFFDTLDGAIIKNLVVAGEETISESGLDFCGGIASQIENARGVDTTFENCVNKRKLTVSGNVGYVGGFTGYSAKSEYASLTFENCINLGEIYVSDVLTEPYVAGFTTGATSYRNCINAGNVTGASYLYNGDNAASGTVAGFDASDSANFEDCINLGDISANSYTAEDGGTYSTEKVYGFSSIDQYNYPTFTNCIDAGSAKQPFTDFDVDITVTYNTCYYNSDSYGSSSSSNAKAKTSDELCQLTDNDLPNWSYDFSNSRYPLPDIEENFSNEIWQEVVAKAIPKVSNFTMLQERIASANGTADNPDVIVLNGTINIS